MKLRLKELGKLQNDLAKAVGLEPAQISRILYGDSRTGAETIVRMAQFLHEDTDEYIRLYTGIPPAENKDWMLDRIISMYTNWEEDDRQLFMDFADFLDRKSHKKGTAEDGPPERETT